MLCMLMAMVDSPEDKRKVEKLYEMYISQKNEENLLG